MAAYPEPGKCDRPGCGNQREQRANSDRYWNQTCGDDECLNWRNARYQQEHRQRLVDERLRQQQGYDLDLPLAHLSPEQHSRLAHSIDVALAAANRLDGDLGRLRRELIHELWIDEDELDAVLDDFELREHTGKIKSRLEAATDDIADAEHRHDLWRGRKGEGAG